MTSTPVANSYVATVEEADAILARRLGATAWTGTTKAAALQQATAIIDSLPLRGNRYEEAYIYNGVQKDINNDGLTQILEFPRVIDGVVCDWDAGTQLPIVPQAVKNACCLEALALMELQASPDKKMRLDLQRQGVTGANYGGTSEQFGGGPNGGGATGGAGDRYHGLMSYEAYRLLRKYIGANLR